jgi:integrase
MPVELKTQRDGRIRDTWYGRYEINGRKHYLNLDVKVAGNPPASLSLRDEGDGAFERSRATALAKLESIVEEARSQRSSERLVEKLYEIKTGEQIKSVKLSELPAEWGRIARKRTPDERYAKQCMSRLAQFAAFVRGQNAKAEEIAHVTRTAARAFLNAEEKRGVTAKTWNDTLVLLRATFQHLLPAGSINPFSGVPTRETETVFRKPFTPEELKAILDAAHDDDFVRPVLVTGVCTAMRRGDCCLLEWKDVDLAKRFITVKTAKTGQTVDIPIFPLLFDELARVEKLKLGKVRAGLAKAEIGGHLTPALSPKGGEGVERKGYVFPEQARMYLDNPDGITWRVRKVFAAAGFKDEGEEADPPSSDSGAAKEGEGAALVVVEASAAVKTMAGQDGAVAHCGDIHAERKGGLRRASVRDFHSFRVTWVTLALTAGVPLELVQKVTGHKTTDIVLKHYFQPGREDFRKALQSAMPKLLTNGQKSPKDEMKDVLDKLTVKNWKKGKARLLALWAKL